LRWLNSTVPYGSPILYADADLAITGGGGIVEVSAVVADVATGGYGISNWTLPEIAAYLAGSDVYVEVGNSSSFDAEMTVYEVWLEVISLSPCFQTLDFHNARKTNTPDVDTAGTEVWSDGNPATSLGPDDVFGGWADLDPYTGPSALDLTVTVQASATSPTLGEVPFGIRVDCPGGSIDLWGGGSTGARATSTGEPLDFRIPTDGVTRTRTMTISDANILAGWGTLAEFYDALRGTCRAEAWIDLEAGVEGADVQIHELSLRVGHKCYVLNPLRIYPRSSTRIYPRRRTRRPGTF
jgi:hypothetical protein